MTSAPLSPARVPAPAIPPAFFWRYLAICTVAPPLLVAAPYFIAVLGRFWIAGAPSNAQTGYIISVTCATPLFQSLAFGVCCGRYRVGARYVAAAALILVADLVFSFIFLREGTICVIMAMPILIVLVAIGAGIGHAIGRAVHSPVPRSSLLPLALLAVSYDVGTGTPVYATSVADTMTINAPADYVWRYIVSYPENRAPADYWLWRIGLPLPTHSVAAAAEIGAARECRFSKGVVLKEKIVDLIPNRLLTFAVTEQPNDPEILGHLALDKGQLLLEPNADGSTTVIATSWYRLFVAPAGYFDWWATDVTRNIHRRVLDHVKHLAEADWLRDHPAGIPRVNGS